MTNPLFLPPPTTRRPDSAAQLSASRHQPPLLRSSPLDARRSTAFTLIELLVVITVIAILAGLTLAAMGGVQKKGARARAESDIQALSSAIEEYHRDFGAYPGAQDLYKELTTDGGVTNTRKVYFEPPPGIVGTNSSIKIFQDPWGAAYIFVTSGSGLQNRGSFDIYSTAGGSTASNYIRN